MSKESSYVQVEYTDNDLLDDEKIFLKQKSDEGLQFKETVSFLDGYYSDVIGEQYLPPESDILI